MFFKFKRKGKIQTATTLQDAVHRWETYRDALLLDGGGASSDIGNGLTVYADRELQTPIAKISYNGRIWPV